MESTPLPKIDQLPPHLLHSVCLHLEAEDIAALGAAGRRLRELLALDNMDNEVWKQKVIDILASRLLVESILVDNLELHVPQRCRAWRMSPAPWPRWKNVYLSYREKFKRSYELWNGDYRADSSNPETQKASAEQLVSLNAEYEQLKDSLRRVQEMTAGAEYKTGLCALAEKCLDILAEVPTHPGCFHILALICLSLNHLEDALRIVHLSQESNGNFEQFAGLEDEIKSLLEKFNEGEDQELLLENSCTLSKPLRSALQSLFEQYDADKDGVLSLDELAALIFKSNGVRPPPEILTHICKNFDPPPTQEANGAEVRCRGLSYEGLCNFYLVQTLEDPEETRSDLAKHGFDSKSLIRVHVPRPA